MGRLRLIIGLLIIVVASTSTGHGQGAITATSNAELLPEMPRRVVFTLDANSSAGEIVAARLFFQPRGATVRISETVEVDAPASQLSLSHEWNMQQNGTPPGTTVDYFWRLTDSAGNEVDTESQSILALDPRFDWQILEDAELAIHWYDASESWGQEMFETGKEALVQLEEELGTDVTQQLSIVAYTNEFDFAAAFPPQQDWIGGQAYPYLGVSVQIIAPNDRGWMRTVIYHELSHLVFAQAMDGAVALVPSWLEEGLAMYNEPQSRDSASRVEQAARQDELLPFSQLQGNFGADGQVVGIAYAQSEMMVTYLLEDCGTDGFQEVVDNLTEESMSVDSALEAACGYDSLTLYNEWRQTLPNAPDLEGDSSVAPEATIPAAGDNDVITGEGEEGSNLAIPALGLMVVLALCVAGIAFFGVIIVGVRLLRTSR